MSYESFVQCKTCKVTITKLEFDIAHEGHEYVELDDFFAKFQFEMTKMSDEVFQRYEEVMGRVRKWEAELDRDTRTIESVLRYLYALATEAREQFRALKHNLISAYNKYQDEQVELLLLTHTNQLGELYNKRNRVNDWKGLFHKDAEQIAVYYNVASSICSFLDKAPRFPAVLPYSESSSDLTQAALKRREEVRHKLVAGRTDFGRKVKEMANLSASLFGRLDKVLTSTAGQVQRVVQCLHTFRSATRRKKP